MRRDDIQSLTRAQPFSAFRVTLMNGKEYDVRHADGIMATNGMAMIARQPPTETEDDRGSVVIVSLGLIQKVEFIGPNAAPPVNRSTV